MSNPDLSTQAKNAFKQLGKSVCILSCVNNGSRHATVSSAVCNVSNHPPSLLICVEKTSSFSTLLTPNASFAVNVLGPQQQHVVDHCMRSKGEERFNSGNWQQSDEKPPVLAQAQANFLCRVAEISAFETHHIIIANIEQAHSAVDTSALIYLGGEFSAIENC